MLTPPGVFLRTQVESVLMSLSLTSPWNMWLKSTMPLTSQPPMLEMVSSFSQPARKYESEVACEVSKPAPSKSLRLLWS